MNAVTASPPTRLDESASCHCVQVLAIRWDHRRAGFHVAPESIWSGIELVRAEGPTPRIRRTRSVKCTSLNPAASDSLTAGPFCRHGPHRSLLSGTPLCYDSRNSSQCSRPDATSRVFADPSHVRTSAQCPRGY